MALLAIKVKPSNQVRATDLFQGNNNKDVPHDKMLMVVKVYPHHHQHHYNFNDHREDDDDQEAKRWHVQNEEDTRGPETFLSFLFNAHCFPCDDQDLSILQKIKITNF